MLEHILVPLDGSERSERALTYAIEISAEDTQITLLYVVYIPVTPFPISPAPPALPQETKDYERYRLQYAEKAERYLQRVKSTMVEQHAAVQTKLLIGKDPAEAIVEFSETQAVDAIVMATRGHSGIMRWFMGSTTQKVLQAVDCPVLIVPT
ncbi:MAG: universal stress protein [Chloroflexota bacterium]